MSKIVLYLWIISYTPLNPFSPRGRFGTETPLVCFDLIWQFPTVFRKNSKNSIKSDLSQQQNNEKPGGHLPLLPQVPGKREPPKIQRKYLKNQENLRVLRNSHTTCNRFWICQDLPGLLGSTENFPRVQAEVSGEWR